MTPAFYSFMNQADFGLGTWYPKGGMKSVIDGMVQMAKELGVQFHNNATIEEIQVDNAKKVKGLDPDKIATIEVMKGPAAIEKYGKKAKNGVVLVTTKK